MRANNALHINSYFLSNKIHYNFLKVISKYRKDKFLIPVYKHFRDNHIQGVDIDYIFTSIDKKVFFTKIPKVLNLFRKKKFEGDFDYIHAHTLISDGIPAYLLSLSLKKKYVVTVRSTDIDYFIPGSFVFRSIAKKILSNASMVFLVSPPHKQRLQNMYPGIVDNKSYLLPNGIDDFWLDNKYERESIERPFESVNILYVGHIIKRKKIDMLINFLQQYDDRNYNLTVVGKNLMELDFNGIAKTLKVGNTINYLGEVTDKDKLLKIYRENDVFVLLSYSETFGVVYIEALSQGLPIIYTRGDGVDGYFDDGEVGYTCNHESLQELKEKMDLVLGQYNRLSKNTTKIASLFEWEHLVNKYMQNINSGLNK